MTDRDPYSGLGSGWAPREEIVNKKRHTTAMLVAGGPTLNLSSSTISDTALVNDLVGTLSVSSGTGVYTYTLTSNPGGLFSISGASLEVAASLTAGSDAITIKADNGAGSVVTQPFLITVTHAAGSVDDDYAAWMAAA